jgi:hypothetical protein
MTVGEKFVSVGELHDRKKEKKTGQKVEDH